MATINLERFLAGSPIAKRARMDVRVVLRRFTASPREIDEGIRGGRLLVSGTPACELVAGGVVLARGTIVETENGPAFKATEVVE